MKEKVLQFFNDCPSLPESIQIAPGLHIENVPEYVQRQLDYLEKNPDSSGTFENIVELYHALTYETDQIYS